MKKINAAFLFLVFLYLLLFPEKTLPAARDGLLLWYRSVLPVLFPFLVVSGMLVRLPGFSSFLRLLYRPFHALFGVSCYGSFAVLSGFLCGFPSGAKITCDLEAQGQISPEEASHLYGFVNNLSPGFLFSYAAIRLDAPEFSLPFVWIVLGSPLCYGILTGQRYKKKAAASRAAFPVSQEDLSFSQLLDRCIWNASVSVLKLCGYLTLFSVLSSALLPLSSAPAGLLLCASLEITGGISLICANTPSPSSRFVLLCAFCIFGGFSALAQTAGIARMNRAVLCRYLKSRVLCTLLGILLASLLLLLRRLFFLFL